MRQYCSGGSRHVVVDPAAVRRLQQRMVEEEAEPTTGLQHAGHLGDRLVDVVDVFEHETRHHGVEAAHRRTAARPRSLRANDAATALGRHADAVPRRIDADDIGARARQRAG